MSLITEKGERGAECTSSKKMNMFLFRIREEVRNERSLGALREQPGKRGSILLRRLFLSGLGEEQVWGKQEQLAHWPLEQVEVGTRSQPIAGLAGLGTHSDKRS